MRDSRLLLAVIFSLVCFPYALGSDARFRNGLRHSLSAADNPTSRLARRSALGGKEFPHTLSVLELNRGGFRYWGWYGLNEGAGIGLARSNDLRELDKVREESTLDGCSLALACCRMPIPSIPSCSTSRSRAATTRPAATSFSQRSEDGIHLTQQKTLVAAVPNQRNQNPNLFRDPRSGRFYLTFYRGNDHDHFEIVSKSAAQVQDLDKAPEKILMQTTETVAAPTLLYLEKAPGGKKNKGIYYLATEIYPHRYTDNPEGEWQVKVFSADSPDGNFQPVAGNPVLRGQRACLFQHVFNNRFYGFDCHLDAPDHWELEFTEAPLP